MFRATIRCLTSSTRGNTTTPLKLLGFNNKQFKKQDKHDLPEFIRSNMSAYPLNLILTEKTKAFSHPLNNIVSDIRHIDGLDNEEDNTDPNDRPMLLDYKVIDVGKNRELHDTFLKEYDCIKSIKKHNIVIVSFTKDGLNSDTSFISSFRKKYDDSFKIKACVLSTQTYPFLRSLKHTKEDNISKNLFSLASLGLTNVHKFKDGSLVLTSESINR